MKKAVLLLAGSILFLGLVAGGGYLYMARDTQGPEIQAESESLVYKASQDKKKFLKQFKALDEKDGDVSESLMLEEIKVEESGKKALVTVVAMDSHNNVTKEEFQVKYKKGKQKDSSADTEKESANTQEDRDTAETANAEPETGADKAQTDKPEADKNETDTNEKTEEKPEAEASAAPTETPQAGGSEEEKRKKEAEEAIKALSPEQPVVRLNKYTDTLPVGSKFDYMTYIEEITDDKDDRSVLFRQINLENHLDASKPGTYEVIYYVNDTQGNTSNRAVLYITIQ